MVVIKFLKCFFSENLVGWLERRPNADSGGAVLLFRNKNQFPHALLVLDEALNEFLVTGIRLNRVTFRRIYELILDLWAVCPFQICRLDLLDLLDLWSGQFFLCTQSTIEKNMNTDEVTQI
jgi:hypothetical protein